MNRVAFRDLSKGGQICEQGHLGGGGGLSLSVWRRTAQRRGPGGMLPHEVLKKGTL